MDKKEDSEEYTDLTILLHNHLDENRKGIFNTYYEKHYMTELSIRVRIKTLYRVDSDNPENRLYYSCSDGKTKVIEFGILSNNDSKKFNIEHKILRCFIKSNLIDEFFDNDFRITINEPIKTKNDFLILNIYRLFNSDKELFKYKMRI